MTTAANLRLFWVPILVILPIFGCLADLSDLFPDPTPVDAKFQTPKAYQPPDPVKYPDDYCANYKGDETFDYIVIGAGAGGSVVSRRLAEDKNIKVLLMEAGGDPPAITDIPSHTGQVSPEQRWHIDTSKDEKMCQGTEGDTCKYQPGKMLGGSTPVNGMMFVRGNRKDYDEWSAMGCKGWSYDEVLPYFKKLENYKVYPLVSKRKLKRRPNVKAADKKYHGTKGPQYSAPFPLDPQTYLFREALRKAEVESGIKYNLDINGADQMGVTDAAGMVDPTGYRNTVVRAYLLHLPDNMKVCKYSTALKLDIEGDKATGVEFQYNATGEVKDFKAKAKIAYVVSAGPFNSPALLERSGIGRKDVLEKLGIPVKKELPGVGENFQDHMGSGTLFQVDYLSDAAKHPLVDSALTLTTFYNTSNPDSSAPDVQFIVSGWLPGSTKRAAMKKGIVDQMKEVIEDGKALVHFHAVSLKHPNPGSIHITQKEDPRVSPEVITNFLTTDLEKERVVKAVHKVRKFMESERLKPHNVKPIVLKECQDLEFNTKEEILCQMRYLMPSFYHNSGTVMMGPKSNPNSVVDPHLRVMGMKNIYVVDSSIFPTITRGNTQIPTMMVAEKGADMIKSARKNK